MSLTLITAPTVEPLTVAECRRQLLQNSSTGEPVPSVITVALASPAIAGSVTAGTHRYLATFVTADGETTAGDISAVVTVADAAVNGKVELTAIPLGGTMVTSRKIYRTAANTSTPFLLLATISNNTATVYTDNIADASLGAAVPTTNTTVDPEITRWITSARSRAERVSHRAICTQTWDLVLDGFPGVNYIEIPKPPLQSITHLKYYDTAGTQQTWTSTNYIVEAPAGDFCQPGRLTLAYGISWPATYSQAKAVTVRFVAGYGAASAVPKMLKEGLLLDVATLSAQRENIAAGSVSVVPGTANDIYRAFRVWATQPRQSSAWSAVGA